MQLKRVLMLDEPDQTEPLEQLFARFKHGRVYDVEVARTGAQATAALQRGRPDLIVLDPQMEGVDGLQLLKKIRATDRTIPVIVVTAGQEARAAAEVLETGVFAYFPKPLKPTAFELIVGLV